MCFQEVQAVESQVLSTQCFQPGAFNPVLSTQGQAEPSAFNPVLSTRGHADVFDLNRLTAQRAGGVEAEGRPQNAHPGCSDTRLRRPKPCFKFESTVVILFTPVKTFGAFETRGVAFKI